VLEPYGLRVYEAGCPQLFEPSRWETGLLHAPDQEMRRLWFATNHDNFCNAIGLLLASAFQTIPVSIIVQLLGNCSALLTDEQDILEALVGQYQAVQKTTASYGNREAQVEDDKTVLDLQHCGRWRTTGMAGSSQRISTSLNGKLVDNIQRLYREEVSKAIINVGKPHLVHRFDLPVPVPR
jgi:hypothetical protein